MYSSESALSYPKSLEFSKDSHTFPPLIDRHGYLLTVGKVGTEATMIIFDHHDHPAEPSPSRIRSHGP